MYCDYLIVGVHSFLNQTPQPDGREKNQPIWTADERLMRGVHLSGVTGMYSDYTFMATAMYHGFTGAERDKSIVKPLYNPSTFDSIMEPFGASIGMVGDISRGTYTMATDSVPHGLAKMPLPLQYIPFWREDVRQMKMWLRNQ